MHAAASLSERIQPALPLLFSFFGARGSFCGEKRI
jgi:hypothetical protein